MDNVTFLDFIEQNYIWILVIIVVILMTAIGYIADKTNFISKNKKDKKKNNNQEEKLYTRKDIEEILKQKEIMDNDFKQNYEDNNFNNKETIISDIDVENNEINNNVLEEKIIPNNVDLHEDELSADNIDEYNKENEIENNSEDLYVGLDGTPNAFNKDESSIDIELPDIDDLKKDDYEDSIEEDSDEDMWKF